MDEDKTSHEEIVEAIFAGRKIEAIKLYRESSGKGLKEAKDFVEELTARLREEQPDRVPPSSQGCGTTVLLFAILVGTLGWQLL